MFGKRKCSKCSKNIGKNFDFCPYCANPLKNLKEEYGLLGMDDNIENALPAHNVPQNSSSFMDKIFTSALNSAMKIMEKEMQKSFEEDRKANRGNIPLNQGNFELFINGKRVNIPGNIAGVQFEELPENKKSSKQKMPKVSDETLKNSSKLPRKEAKSKLTRDSNKVIYELETPGLKSLNNVLINKLENSIEVKAYTDNAVYHKTLPGKLPLMQYAVSPEQGKLILEFKA